MKTQRNLNGKFMEEKLKHGYATEYFAKYFGVTTEEFLKMLEKEFSTKAYKSMVSRLRKNEKLACPKKKKEPVSKENVNHNTSVEKNERNLLETLELQREDLQSSLNNLELEHKSLASDRNQIKKQISNYKSKLLQFQSEIRQCEKEICDLATTLDKKLITMKSLNSSIADVKSRLAEVNLEIETLHKISIFLYSSGEIEIEAPFIIEIPDEWIATFNLLVQDDSVGSLTINQLKSISKYYSLEKFFKSQNWSFEIAFEDNLMEEFYQKVKENLS